MRHFRPFRRLLASALGVLLLQAFLAPGDLACALRHHADASDRAGHAGMMHDTHGASRAPAAAPDHRHHATARAHESGDAAGVSHARVSSPMQGDQCGDAMPGHCAWMSACAPVAVMVPACPAAPQLAVARHAPAPGRADRALSVAHLPDVPPPRA